MSNSIEQVGTPIELVIAYIGELKKHKENEKKTDEMPSMMVDSEIISYEKFCEMYPSVIKKIETNKQ